MKPLHWGLLALWLVVLVWSFINPHDRFTWWLEVLPALIGLVIVFATGRRFPLTPLVYVLLTLHCLILMVGGHYTYAEVPAGHWVKEAFGLARNHYDRLGHFAQGFVPAMVAREILLRKGVLARRGWLPFLIVCICLSISACYEFIEWWTALATGEAADAFLGSQGDPWDSQWDMFLATLGAISALLFLGRWHDRQLAQLPRS